MASKITSYTCVQNDDIFEYTFKLNGYEFEFDIVRFHGIKEYIDLMEDGDINIFKPLMKYSNQIKHIVGYDWDILKKANKDVNIFDLVKSVEWIGKRYVMEYWPDVIFYEAEDKRLHRIYERMFPSFGYHLTYSIGNSYVYTKFSKVIIKIIEEEK